MPTIRSATTADIEGVVDLWDRAAGPTRRAGRPADVERLLQRGPGALIVAEWDGRIVGSLVLGWDGWRCHLYRLAVDEATRRAGIAGALIAEARVRASAHGAGRLDAMVNIENAGAVAFWESAGFERDRDDERWSLLLERTRSG